MFHRKKTVPRLKYDPAEKKPVIRASICTGEQVGGLKDLRTGKFEDIMLIRTEKDLWEFQDMVGQTHIDKEY